MFLNINQLSKSPRASLARQQGFGLIEVMIAMTLGLFIIAGISEYYLSSRQTDSTNQVLRQITDNARFLINRIGQEGRMAGYTGVLQLTPSNLLNNPSFLAYDFSTGVTGFDNISVGAMSAVLTSHLSGDPQPITNTDILILRTTHDVQPVSLTTDSTASNFSVPNNIQSSRTCSTGLPISGICNGDILLISNLRNAVFFQASSIASSGSSAVVTHVATGTPGNQTTSWTTAFNATAEVIPYQTVTYFLANGANGLPALFRKENGNTAIELISDVANFQVTYGEDTTGDKSVDGTYVTANNVTNWANVLSVRISLLLASHDNGIVNNPMSVTAPAFPDGSTTATDRRLYKSLVFTTALRNRIQ